jgi:hypothetical protein
MMEESSVSVKVPTRVAEGNDICSILKIFPGLSTFNLVLGSLASFPSVPNYFFGSKTNERSPPNFLGAASSVTRTITETLVLKTDENGYGERLVLEPGTIFRTA